MYDQSLLHTGIGVAIYLIIDDSRIRIVYAPIHPAHPACCDSWKKVTLHSASIILLLKDVVVLEWWRLAVWKACPISVVIKTKVCPGSPMTMGTVVETGMPFASQLMKSPATRCTCRAVGLASLAKPEVRADARGAQRNMSTLC